MRFIVIKIFSCAALTASLTFGATLQSAVAEQNLSFGDVVKALTPADRDIDRTRWDLGIQTDALAPFVHWKNKTPVDADTAGDEVVVTPPEPNKPSDFPLIQEGLITVDSQQLLGIRPNGKHFQPIQMVFDLVGTWSFIQEADIETGWFHVGTPISLYEALIKGGFQVKRLTCYQDSSQIDKAMLIQISSRNTHPVYGLLEKNCGMAVCNNILRISYFGVSYTDLNTIPTINNFPDALPDTPHFENLSECQGYFTPFAGNN